MFRQVILVHVLMIVLCSAHPLVNKTRNSNRIVGGFEIDIEEVPWQVSLQIYSSHFCGGSIISQNWILTAAHCAVNTKPSSVTIRTGSNEHASGGSIVKVEQIIVHAGFNSRTIDYDFALLKLSDPLKFTGKLSAIKLPNEQIEDGSICLVSGWGTTQNSSESRAYLRGAEIPVVNHSNCNQAYKGVNDITERMMCAGYKEGGKDSCQGDSGGPLTCQESGSGNRKLYGVVSWGYGCARPGYPGVYSRVVSVRKWIKENSGI